MDDLSPLKFKPLRAPGQSIDEALDKLATDRLLPYVIFRGFFWAVALMEWIARAGAMPRSPELYVFIAAGLTVWSIWRVHRMRPRIERLKLGRDGERAVGQFLEGLRITGARVFHDVPAEGFNLDHVVISERGIYAVETKAWRKRYKGESLTVRGTELYRGNALVAPNPLVQATAQASWLRNLLRDSTGKALPVRGVLVFPRWFVKADGYSGEHLDFRTESPTLLYRIGAR